MIPPSRPHFTIGFRWAGVVSRPTLSVLLFFLQRLQVITSPGKL